MGKNVWWGRFNGWMKWWVGEGGQGTRMEPWDGRCRLVGLASGSVYRKQMGYACSTPYFTRIYCLLFRDEDDIGPCLPGVALMSLIASPHRFHCHYCGSQIRDNLGLFFSWTMNLILSLLGDYFNSDSGYCIQVYCIKFKTEV